MRLICPSCGTEYEVEAAAIPPEGRDVQCSSCQTVWFQTASAGDTVSDPMSGTAFEEEALEPVPPAAEAEDLEPEVSFDAPPPLPQRALDPQVLAILHQEAARETAARAAEKAMERAKAESTPPVPAAFDTAPAAKEPPKVAKTPPKATAKVAVKAPAAKAPPAAKAEAVSVPVAAETPGTADAPPRRGKARPALPDVEMVKSSLTAREAAPLAAHKGGLADPRPVRSGRGFGRGFAASLLVGGLLWGAYAQAPRLVQIWPPAAPYLSAYVQKVDGWRRDVASGLARVTRTWRRSDTAL